MTNRSTYLKNLMIIIKIILSIFLVYIIFIQVDISAIAEKIAQMAPSWIIAVAFFFVIQVTCAAQRWRYVLAGMQQHLTTRSALRLIFLGQFFNQCLPSNIGGDTLRMFYLRREGIGTGSAIRSVLLDRIAGLLILTLLCSISLPFLIKHLENQIAIMGLLAIIVVGWAAVGILLVLDNPLTHRFRDHKFLGMFLSLSKDARRLTRDRMVIASLLTTSVLIHMCSVGMIWAIDKALGGDTSYLFFAFTVIPTLLVVSIPISIAGWGLREQAMVIILGGLGISATHAVSISILFGAALILGSLPGAVFWLKTDRNTDRN